MERLNAPMEAMITGMVLFLDLIFRTAGHALVIVDDNSNLISYKGNWTDVQPTGSIGSTTYPASELSAYNSTVHQTQDATAEAALSFKGTVISVYGLSNPEGELSMTYSIDGAPAIEQSGVSSPSDDVPILRLWFHMENLPEENHNLTMKMNSTPCNDGAYFILDFIIYGSTPEVMSKRDPRVQFSPTFDLATMFTSSTSSEQLSKLLLLLVNSSIAASTTSTVSSELSTPTPTHSGFSTSTSTFSTSTLAELTSPTSSLPKATLNPLTPTLGMVSKFSTSTSTSPSQGSLPALSTSISATSMSATHFELSSLTLSSETPTESSSNGETNSPNQSQLPVPNLKRGTPVGAIVGAVLGGLFVISVLLLTWNRRRVRRLSNKGPSDAPQFIQSVHSAQPMYFPTEGRPSIHRIPPVNVEISSPGSSSVNPFPYFQPPFNPDISSVSKTGSGITRNTVVEDAALLQQRMSRLEREIADVHALYATLQNQNIDDEEGHTSSLPPPY
ncbi:hypothetical protein H0H93_009792 [Arthromyces matolae]|nr:hypothetical protein H0H93_009792 [Arthromyces matolae]